VRTDDDQQLATVAKVCEDFCDNLAFEEWLFAVHDQFPEAVDNTVLAKVEAFRRHDLYHSDKTPARALSDKSVNRIAKMLHFSKVATLDDFLEANRCDQNERDYLTIKIKRILYNLRTADRKRAKTRPKPTRRS
jgi:hypothetical protein